MSSDPRIEKISSRNFVRRYPKNSRIFILYDLALVSLFITFCLQETIHLQQTLTQSRLLQRKWTKLFAIYAALAYVALNLAFYTFFLPENYLTRTYAVMISTAVGAL